MSSGSVQSAQTNMGSNMKTFKMQHLFVPSAAWKVFDEDTAPDWLTSVNTVPGSTMDGRWFWNEHILRLEVGESKDTDFQRITRLS